MTSSDAHYIPHQRNWGEPERAPYGIEKRPPRTIYLCTYVSVLRKPWIWDNPWIVLRKAWIGRYPQFAQDNPWIAPRRAVKRKPHLREVRPGAAEILSRLCLFVNSENSQLAKWCGLYSLSLSLSLALSAMEVR